MKYLITTLAAITVLAGNGICATTSKGLSTAETITKITIRELPAVRPMITKGVNDRGVKKSTDAYADWINQNGEPNNNNNGTGGANYNNYIPPVQTPVSSINPAISTVSDITYTANEIINTGRNLISLIKENAAVLDVRESEYASAIPTGALQNWDELKGFRTAPVRTFQMTGTTQGGFKAVTIVYQVFYKYGGTFRGQGKYLRGVRIKPVSVSTAYGYKVDVWTAVGDISNAAPEGRQPLALMTLELNMSYQANSTRARFKADVFDIYGDGRLVHIGGNTPAVNTIIQR